MSMSESNANGGRGPTYHHVPEECCIVVRSDVTLTNPEERAKFLSAAHAALSQEFGPEMQPLERHEGQNAIILDNHPAGGTTAHLYYRWSAVPGTADEMRNAPHHTRLLRLNHGLGLHNKPKSIGTMEIHAVTPHWLAVACDSPGVEGGGPAAPPESTEDGRNWRFSFYREDKRGAFGKHELQEAVERDRALAADDKSSGVVVAVLDSSPSRSAVSAAVKEFRDNALLQQVAGLMNRNGAAPKDQTMSSIKIDGPLVATATDLSHLKSILPHWLERVDEWFGALDPAKRADLIKVLELHGTQYGIPDHGLFVAGIIKDIAPAADIHLIRALDSKGVADLLSLSDALSALPSRFPGRRIIVNLSLTFSFPKIDEFLQYWERMYPKDVNAHDKDALHDVFHQSLKDVTDWLAANDILVIAAVGNRDHRLGRRPGPAFPASYPNVLGVAAISRDLEPAEYSKKAAAPENGIATLGGNTTWDSGKPAIADARDGGRDAIHGVFSAVDLPHQDQYAHPYTAVRDGGNKTGWVDWVGTSFATPIVTGLAAALWQGDLEKKTPGEMIDVIRGFADDHISGTTRDTLNCDAIFAEQVPI